MENFNFKKSFKPRRDFEEKTKNLFLSAFNEKFAGFAKPAPSFAFNYVLRGAGVFATLLLLVTGTSTYAYGKNVGPNNLLYPLKRYHEMVLLSLKKGSEKPAFHFKLAERRLEEVEKIKSAENGASREKAQKITEDLRNEIKQSFGSTQPKRNDNDFLPDEPVKQPEVKSEPVKPTLSPKINPPIFGPPKDQIKETEIIKQNLIRENISFPKSSKISPGIKADEKSLEPQTSTNQTQICKFVSDLIASETNGIKKEIINDPEIAQKFNASCDGIESAE